MGNSCLGGDPRKGVKPKPNRSASHPPRDSRRARTPPLDRSASCPLCTRSCSTFARLACLARSTACRFLFLRARFLHLLTISLRCTRQHREIASILTSHLCSAICILHLLTIPLGCTRQHSVIAFARATSATTLSRRLNPVGLSHLVVPHSRTHSGRPCGRNRRSPPTPPPRRPTIPVMTRNSMSQTLSFHSRSTADCSGRGDPAHQLLSLLRPRRLWLLLCLTIKE